MDPGSVEPSVVAIFAMAPSIAAGLVFFRLLAVEMLAVGATVAAAAFAASRLRNEPLGTGLFLSALVGIALVGPGAPPAWVAAVAIVAVGLELARERYTPAARLQSGLVAYSLVWLLSRGTVVAYVNPGSTTAMTEPIRYWLQYFGDGQSPIDPVRLYVGNVAGPVFATSLLAVAVGAAWLWYARRLSLIVVITFLVGAAAPVVAAGWSPAYQLLSGPLWFAAALVLADTTDLPRSPISRSLMGLLAGAVAIWLRAEGLAIESALAAIAAVQAGIVGVQATQWLIVNRQKLSARWAHSAAATIG